MASLNAAGLALIPLPRQTDLGDTNDGTIIGGSSYGIRIISSHADTITNSGTIAGGGGTAGGGGAKSGEASETTPGPAST